MSSESGPGAPGSATTGLNNSTGNVVKSRAGGANVQAIGSAKRDKYADTAAKIDKAAKKPADWRAGLARRGETIVADLRNTVAAFRACPDLADTLRFNEFTNAVETARKLPWRVNAPGSAWSETDDAEALVFMQQHDIGIRSTITIAEAVQIVARDWMYHPVRQYLQGLVHDGDPRLDVMLQAYFGAIGSPQYLSAVGRRFMVSAVARAMKPGCQCDHVPVWEGPQGTGKSTAVRIFARRPEWYAGSLPDMHTKDAALQLVGHWIVEMSELKAVKGSEIESSKAFISTCHDTLRPPYGRRSIQLARQCVFIGTTNERTYLRDKTGNRRFWPIRCGRIDTAGLEKDMDQLWAEAVALYNAGEQWHLTPAEQALAESEQAERVQETELEVDTREYLATLTARGRNETTVKEVLTEGHGLEYGTASYADNAKRLGVQVAEAMERAGWHKVGRTGGGYGKRTVYRRA